MQFDINTLDESVRGEVQGYIQEQVTSKLDSEVKGLKDKNSELLSKEAERRQQINQYEEKLNKYNVLGDRQPEDIAGILDSLEQGKIDLALEQAKGDPAKLDEVVNLRISKERKQWQAEQDAKYNDIATKYETSEAERQALNERVKVMSLDEVSKAHYRKLPDAQLGADQVIADEVRKVFTLDEDGKPVALDPYGEPMNDHKGNPLTIEYFVTEQLRDQMPFLFAAPNGGGGKGSSRSSSSGFGTGITSRKGWTPETISTFIKAAESAGKTSEEAMAAWHALPAD